MVKINFCPSCGCELNKGSFECPKCGLDFKDIVENRHLLVCNDADNSIEYFEGNNEFLTEEEVPIFDFSNDENNVEIMIDESDLVGPDGMPREIPIEIFVEGEEDVQLELVSENPEDANIRIEQSEDGGLVIKPNISFTCPVCGAQVGEDLICKSCFSEFMLAPDENNDK